MPLALLALGGCALIDQTMFFPAPPPRASLDARARRPARIDPRTPLLVIGPATPLSDYPALLRLAVRAAQRRDPDVRFDVTAVAAPGQADAATDQAAAVMRALAEDGVSRHRILLRAVLDPGRSGHQVRVYVR